MGIYVFLILKKFNETVQYSFNYYAKSDLFSDNALIDSTVPNILHLKTNNVGIYDKTATMPNCYNGPKFLTTAGCMLYMY